MSKITTESIEGSSHHYPKVATIVTASARGKDNAMAVAWHTSISISPPLYGISLSSKRFTYELIADSKEFGINFMPFDKAFLVAKVGGTSGRVEDKFERFNMVKEKPLKTGVPILKDAYAAYECRLVDSRAYGDHIWLVGEIVAVHFLEEALSQKRILDLDKVRPLLYLGSEFYASTDKSSLQFIKRGV